MKLRNLSDNRTLIETPYCIIHHHCAEPESFLQAYCPASKVVLQLEKLTPSRYIWKRLSSLAMSDLEVLPPLRIPLEVLPPLRIPLEVLPPLRIPRFVLPFFRMPLVVLPPLRTPRFPSTSLVTFSLAMFPSSSSSSSFTEVGSARVLLSCAYPSSASRSTCPLLSTSNPGTPKAMSSRRLTALEPCEIP